MLNFVTNNEDETKVIGYKLASKLKPRDIVVLSRRFR